MAFGIDNPLGAMGYAPTVLPDMTAGIQALQKTEIANRLKEIEQEKQWKHDEYVRNEKAALELAMPIKHDFLSKKLAQRFAEDSSKLMSKLADFSRRTNGKIGSENWPEMLKMQEEKQGLINQTMRDKSLRDAFGVYQKEAASMYNQLKTPEEKAKWNKQQAELDRKMSDPNYDLDVSAFYMATQPPTPPVSVLIQKRAAEILPLVQGAIKSTAPGMSAADPQKVREQVGRLMESDDFLFNEGASTRWKSKDDMINEMSQIIETAIKPDLTGFRPSSGGSGGGGVDKNARDYTPSPYEYGKNKYNMVQIPSDVSQVDRNFFINKAKNLDTGETVQLDQNKASLLGVDVDKGVVILKGTGGFAMKDGKPLFIKEGSITPPKIDGEYNADTMATLSNPTRQETILKGAYTGDRPVEGFKNVSLEENEDGITLKGTVVVDKKLPFTGSSEVPMEVRYTKFKDPKAEAVFEAPLNENKPAVAIMFPKVKVRGVPLEQYVDRGASSQQTLPELSVSAYNKAKGKSYTKKQIQDAFGSQYKIVE